MSRSTVILKAGSTFADLARTSGDYEDWIVAGLMIPEEGIRVVHGSAGEPLPSAEAVAGVVISGAHEMVTDGAPWVIAASHWLRDLVARRIPVLGICYGHQLLAHALGGEVGYHPRGWEVGTVSVRCLPAARADPLLGVLPATFVAQATHAQSVLRLPPSAVRLAGTDFDPVHAFRVGDCAWGVQFHPEFSAAVLRIYIARQRTVLTREGHDVDRLVDAVTDSPAGAVLGAFGRVVRGGGELDWGFRP